MLSLASALRILLGVPLFFYLPGYLLSRGWLSSQELRGLECHVGRVIASVLLTGWLGLILAQAGIFSYPILAASLACISGVMAVALRGRQSPRPDRAGGPHLGIVAGARAARSGTRLEPARLAALRSDHLLLLIVILFGLVVARPFEMFRGGLDAGVYANTGVAVARTGSLVQYDPIVAPIGARAAQGDSKAQQIESNIFGVQSKQRYMATRLRAAGFFINEGEVAQGRVVPQFFHLWPVWIAIFVSMLGPAPGLVATGAAGALGVVLLGLIGRRIGGAAVGVVAAAFLASMTPQVWFSRMSTSEALTQVWLLAGMWAYMQLADSTERRQRIWWGALAGAAFGAGVLTRIDFAVALAPVLGLLLYLALTRRWHAGYTALALMLLVFLIHAGLHTLLIARAYFFDTTYHALQHSAITVHLSLPFLNPELRSGFSARAGAVYTDRSRLAVELAIVVGGCLALAAAWRWPDVLRAVERAVIGRRKLLLGTWVLSLGLLAAYAYLVRPGILTYDVLRRPFQAENWLRLQGYIGAPIAVPSGYKKETLALALANMVRLGWYLSPLGIMLAVIGGLHLWWKIDRRTWLLVVTATMYAIFYIRSLYGTGQQTYIYILRRYVPLVYPALLLSIAYVLVLLWGARKPGWPPPKGLLHTARWATSALLVVGLLLFFVVTGRSVYAHTEYAGALAQIEGLSHQIGEHDIVLVRGGGANSLAVRDTPELVVAPLTYVYGRNALPVKGSFPGKYPAAFGEQITRWRGEGRRVYLLLAASGGDLLFPGYAPRPIGLWTLALREFQQLRDQKPKLAYTNGITFQLYELVPEGEVAMADTLMPDDTAAQVSGFYPAEAGAEGEPRGAWTNGLAVLRLPAGREAQTLTLHVSGGARPSTLPATRLCVDVAPEPGVYPEGGVAETLPWRELQCGEVGAAEQRLDVALPAQQGERALLVRLRSETWVPASTTPNPGTLSSSDRRSLGVRFIGATLMPSGAAQVLR